MSDSGAQWHLLLVVAGCLCAAVPIAAQRPCELCLGIGGGSSPPAPPPNATVEAPPPANATSPPLPPTNATSPSPPPPSPPPTGVAAAPEAAAASAPPPASPEPAASSEAELPEECKQVRTRGMMRGLQGDNERGTTRGCTRAGHRAVARSARACAAAPSTGVHPEQAQVPPARSLPALPSTLASLPPPPSPSSAVRRRRCQGEARASWAACLQARPRSVSMHRRGRTRRGTRRASVRRRRLRRTAASEARRTPPPTGSRALSRQRVPAELAAGAHQAPAAARRPCGALTTDPLPASRLRCPAPLSHPPVSCAPREVTAAVTLPATSNSCQSQRAWAGTQANRHCSRVCCRAATGFLGG